MCKMRKLVVAAIVALGLLVTAAPAAAISDEQACIESGGTYFKDGGTSFCEYPVGNSDNVKTTSEKGSFSSSHPEELTNPGGNMPPGQQGGDTLR